MYLSLTVRAFSPTLDPLNFHVGGVFIKLRSADFTFDSALSCNCIFCFVLSGVIDPGWEVEKNQRSNFAACELQLDFIQGSTFKALLLLPVPLSQTTKKP